MFSKTMVNEACFGMNIHLGEEADTGVVCSVETSSGKLHDLEA